MNWIVDNWFLLVLLCAAIVLGVIYVIKFFNRPTEEQIKQVKEWLLFAVIQAETMFGTGTGQLKLRYVYDLFLQRFPALVTLIPFEVFSKFVDEVLNQMKHVLDTNLDIAMYVKSGGKY